MKAKLLTQNSITLMAYLMENETVRNKVKAAGEEGKSYAIYSFRNDGIVVLGETKYPFWNQLIGCRFKLPFAAWALAVWDALVDLSTGANSEALEEGLSVEIAKKAKRETEYNWVVERLVDCYRHVCDKVDGGVSLEGGAGKSGSSSGSTRCVVFANDPEVNVNINVEGVKRTLRVPDATGRAFLDLDLGVTGVHVRHD